MLVASSGHIIEKKSSYLQQLKMLYVIFFDTSSLYLYQPYQVQVRLKPFKMKKNSLF